MFSGGFDLDAAVWVCSGDGLDPADVRDVLDGLVNKSIVWREDGADGGDGTRYGMLETMRQYGEDRLVDRGDRERLRRRHRDCYLALTERFGAEWFGPDEIGWLDWFNREHANLRAALEFCLTDPDEAVVGLRIWHNVKDCWANRGLNTEARMWTKRLLELAPPDAPHRVTAHWIYAFLSLVQGDTRAYQAALADVDELAERDDDDLARAFAHHARGYAGLIGNDSAVAAREFTAAAEMFRAQRQPVAELWCRYNYGLAASVAGDRDAGRAVLRDCIDTCLAQGDVFWRAWSLWSRGVSEYLFGEMAEAERSTLAALRLQRRVNDQLIIGLGLLILAGCAANTGRPSRAARLFGAGTSVWRSLGASPNQYGAVIEPMEQAVKLVIGALGADAANGEFAVGAGLRADQALAYALGELPEPTAARGELTRRELEVAALVADGMSNQEIADKLVIARRTAETHVAHIMTKLGFNGRAQIAAWVVRGGRA